MTVDPALLEVVLGPLGALVVLVMGLASILWWRILVPGYVLEAAEKREAALEGENHTLQATVIEMNRHNSELKAEVAGLRKEVEYLRREVEGLRKRVGDD